MSDHTDRAQAIVGRYWKWAAAAGLIPVPLVDFAAVTAVQLKMIADLAHLYRIPFREDLAKAIVGSLAGALSAPILSTAGLRLMAPALKALPGIGMVVGVIAIPASNAATTYALGRVFIQHFESGGTFLDLKPDEVREYYRRELQGPVNQGRTATVGG